MYIYIYIHIYIYMCVYIYIYIIYLYTHLMVVAQEAAGDRAYGPGSGRASRLC